MSLKETKLGKFYSKRKKLIFGAGGMYTIFGFKGGFIASLWIIPLYATIMRGCPAPEHKMMQHPYSIDVVIEKVKLKKDNSVKIDAYYYNQKGKKKSKPYYIEPNGDGKIYKMDHKEITDIIHKYTVGDSVQLNGYESRGLVKYVTKIEPWKKTVQLTE